MLTPEERNTFSDLEKVLRGKTGKNSSIGIISAENSMGKRLPDSVNNKRNELLSKKLNSHPKNKVYPLQGNFEGVMENSYLVTGVSLDELEELAKEFGQLSFIYGNGVEDNMIFHYMEVDENGDYNSTQIRRTFAFRDEARENYSSYKGVKFVIPFFDDDYINKKWSQLSSEDRGGEDKKDQQDTEVEDIENNKDNGENKMESTRFGRITELLDSLKLDEKTKVKIKVKHSDLLEIPEDKNFWQVPFKHYTDLVDKKGYAKVIRALNNIKVWDKNEEPQIAKKADALMDKLKAKFRPDDKNEGLMDNIKNNIPKLHQVDIQGGRGGAIGAGTPEQIEKAKFIAKVKAMQARKEGKSIGAGSVSKADLDNYDHFVQLHKRLSGEGDED